jgi:hypothetical protein
MRGCISSLQHRMTGIPLPTKQNLTTEFEVFWVVTLYSVLVGWRWRQYGPLKHWYPTTTVHSITTQNSNLGHRTSLKSRYITTFSFYLYRKIKLRISVCCYQLWSRDSLVVMALGYGLDDSGSIPPGGVGIFFFSTASRSTLGPNQPPIQWVPGGVSPGGKAAGEWGWPLTSV